MKKQHSYLELTDKGQRKLEAKIKVASDNFDVKTLDKLNRKWDILPAMEKKWDRIEKREQRKYDRETNKGI